MLLRTFIVIVTLVFSAFSPDANAGQNLNNQLIRMGKRVESRVAKLRGLPVKRPVRWEITTKQKVRKYLKKSMAEQYGPGEMEKEGQAMKALGLIPPGMQYQASVISLLEEQVGGFYDPKTEIFYLADWIAPSTQETIIAHELCHALQDQSFDIDKFVQRDPHNSDAMLAHSSVLEGEATLVMMLYSLGDSTMDLDLSMVDFDGALGSLMISISSFQFPKFGQAPKALRDSLMFPYLKGLKFISYGKKIGGWKEIDKVYSHLPSSTEQVIHPEKFFLDRDDPSRVDLDFIEAQIKSPWEKIYEDVMGEFMTGQLLNLLDDRNEQQRGAAGWDGDKVKVFRRGSDLAWVGLWVFDSETDAIEYAGAFSKTVALRTQKLTMAPVDNTPTMRWKSDEGKSYLVSRLSKRVLIVYGLDSATTQTILEAATARFNTHPSLPGGQ